MSVAVILGFIERAAAELCIESEAARKWRARGVPWKHRLAILELAERNVDFDRAAFDMPPGRRRGTIEAPS
jgi:hypothetical protein